MSRLFQVSEKWPTRRTTVNSCFFVFLVKTNLNSWSVLLSISWRMPCGPLAFEVCRACILSIRSFSVMGTSNGFCFFYQLYVPYWSCLHIYGVLLGSFLCCCKVVRREFSRCLHFVWLCVHVPGTVRMDQWFVADFGCTVLFSFWGYSISVPLKFLTIPMARICIDWLSAFFIW